MPKTVELSQLSFFEPQGIRFDCYFTIEELHLDRKASCAIYGSKIMLCGKGKTLVDLVMQLKKDLKGVDVHVSTENPAVVHIVDKRLHLLKEYGLNRNVDVVLTGTPFELLETLKKRTDLIAPPAYGVVGSEMSGFDWATRISVHAKSQAARQILTDYLPLSQYKRLLWVAESVPRDGKYLTSIQYCGRMRYHPNGKELDAFHGGEKLDFDEGAMAFAVNRRDAAGVVTAIKFIQSRLKEGRPHQVRWAMFYLGECKSQEAIPILVENIDYVFTRCGILEESYPAVKALRLMGKLVSEPVQNALDREDNELRRTLLCRVLLEVEGRMPAVKLIEARLATAVKNPERNARLEAARKILLQYP